MTNDKPTTEKAHARPSIRALLTEAADTQHTACLTWREARVVLDGLDRLERAEGRVARVEGTISAYQAAHSHLGIHLDEFGPSVRALRIALSDNPTPPAKSGDDRG